MRFFVAQLRSTDGVGMHDPWERQGEPFEHSFVPRPLNMALRRPPRQPLLPEPPHLMVQQDQALEVARDAKVAVMALQHPAQSLVLLAERPMPHPLASLIDRLERARKSIFRRQLPHHNIALPRLSPYMGKAEEVEGRRQRRFWLTCRSSGPEVDQPGLVRVQLQPELTQPLGADRNFKRPSGSRLPTTLLPLD